jgi:hypothetical protein
MRIMSLRVFPDTGRQDGARSNDMQTVRLALLRELPSQTQEELRPLFGRALRAGVFDFRTSGAIRFIIANQKALMQRWV